MVSHKFQWNYQGTDVKVTGEFDNWSATTTMEKNADGHFVKTIELPAFSKVYYKFVVDGHWCVDGQALKEGEGAHENNYILTGAHEDSETTKSLDHTSDQLPVLGHGASYINASASDPSREATEIPVTSQDNFSSSVQTNVDRLDESSATVASVPKASTYDDSGPSPSDPQAVRNARDNPLSDAYSSAIDHLPTREELTHEVQHAAEVAGGFLAAGLAAGAAALGLSTHASHTESHPITGRQTTSNAVISEVPSSASAASSVPVASQSTTRASSTTQAHVTDKENATKIAETTEDSTIPDKSLVSQTGTLEQAAVAAATSAATNAYNASGLSGLSGSGLPTSDISKDGNLGFTGIGTAVNAETGVVGSSKIVQGINDFEPISDTHTANLDSATASTLLEHHENGAKVERIGEHTVLAEVGIGGAAIGTAVVTDETVTSTRGLSIPAQAAEHLQQTPQVSTVHEAYVPTHAVEDSGLAPALSRDNAPVETLSKESVPAEKVVPQAIATVSSEPAVSATTKTSTAAAAEVAADTSRSTSKVTTSTAQTSNVPSTITNIPSASASIPAATTTTSKAASAAPVQASKVPVASVSTDEATSSRPATAAIKTSKVSAATATSTKPSDVSSAPPTPSKAAAQAASKSSVMRKNARSAFNSDSTTAPSEDGARKKKGLLNKMKSMFGGKQK